MENILEVKNLNKDYGNFKLENVNFSLERSYIMGFIGPNGAGKSTTIKLIMNLIKRNSGEIKVFGKDNIADEKEIKNKIGFVYDENCFYEDLSIREIKRIIAPFYRDFNDENFKKYLRDFDLDPKKKIKELSKGMKMKFSLAMALSHDAELIIMDEPTSGLDPVFRSDILDILYATIQDERRSVFFSTHITTDIEKVADYITFINNGKVVFSKEKDDILENYVLVKGEKNLIDRDTKQNFIGIRENAYGFEALANEPSKIRNIFGNSVVIEKARLDDIMLHVVKGGRENAKLGA